MNRCIFLIVCGFLPAALAADQPLADAAKPLAASLAAGCIATGERIGDQIQFAIAPSKPAKEIPGVENLAFEIGSITKVLTGLLLAQAIVEGKVTLDTPIGDLLDESQSYADPRVAAITLKQLATHTSGLPRLPANMAAGVVDGDPYASYDDNLLGQFLATAKLKGEGPFRCSYSNLGFGLLGQLLGRTYEMPWSEAVTKKICMPLGLRHTTADISKSELTLAPPFSGSKQVKSWTFEAMAGAGALRSTVADLIKFGEAIADPAATPLADAFRLALTPHAAAPAHGGHIGLGIFMRKTDGAISYHHDGGTGGYRSGLQVIPAKGIVRVALINNDSLSGSAVISATNKSKPTAPVKRQEITLSCDALDACQGIYELDNDSRFTVLLSNDQLWVRLTGQPFLRVFAHAPDRFFYKAVDAEIAFQRNGGEVESLTLFQNGSELTAQRSSDPLPSIRLRTAKELEPYAGTYSLFGMKDFRVSVKEAALFAQLAGQPAAPVFETAADKFEYDVAGAAIVFTRNEQGSINGLTLLQHGIAMPAPKETK